MKGCNVVQVTERMSSESGAKMMRDLVAYGVAKEGVEFIKKAGLLPPPDGAHPEEDDE